MIVAAEKNLLFSRDEYRLRVEQHRKYMQQEGLDHLILVQPESVTYLTGYSTVGYTSSFAAVVLSASGDPTLIVRRAEEYWYANTSWCPEPIWWYDGETILEVLQRSISELALRGNIGIEGWSWRAPYQMIAALISQAAPHQTFITNCDVAQIRLVKSEAEIALMRRAGQASDAMLEAAVQAVAPGMTEKQLASIMSAAGMASGSSHLESGPVSSGEAANHIHATYTDRAFETNDLIFIEVNTHRHSYYARCMRSIALGTVGDTRVGEWNDIRALQDEALGLVKNGANCRVADDLLRNGLRELGLVPDYPNKTFYGIGFMLEPTAFEPIEVTARSDFEFKTGMTLHAYLVVNGLNISETIVVGDSGVERLTNYSRDLVVK